MSPGKKEQKVPVIIRFEHILDIALVNPFDRKNPVSTHIEGLCLQPVSYYALYIFEMKGHLARKSDCCLAEIKDTPMFTVHLLLPLLYNQRGL